MSTKENFKVLRAFMDETEEFYSDVVEVAEGNLRNKDIKKYPDKMLKSYKKDLEKTHKVYEKFCDFTDGIDPENPDKKKVVMASKLRGDLAAQCELLDAQNGMFTAYLDAKLAATYTGVIELMALVVKNGEKQLDRAIAKVEKLTKELKKAKKLVTQAEIQRGINVAITVATTVILPELKAAQAVYVAVSVAAARTKLDDMLGPKGATAAGAAKNVATEYAGCATSLGKAVNSSASVISGIDTLISDGVEVKTAEKILKKAKKDLAEAQKMVQKLEVYGKSDGSTLLKLTIALEKAQSTSASKIKSYKAAKQKKADLEKDIEYQD